MKSNEKCYSFQGSRSVRGYTNIDKLPQVLSILREVAKRS